MILATEYLALEATSDSKHEYLRGEIFAMAGTTIAHNLMAGNLAMVLRAHLRGSRCRVLMADVKLRIEASDAYFYPDVFVTCAEEDRADPLIQRHARLVVEVLSDSTAAYDRGEKFDEYRGLESLEEYLLVDSRVQQVIINRKREGGVWEFEVLNGAGILRLDSVKLSLPVASLYEDTDVPKARVVVPRR